MLGLADDVRGVGVADLVFGELVLVEDQDLPGLPHPDDVQIEILFCGICHSDLHQVRNEWEGLMPTVYPCIPGHEIVGRVTKVGSAVSKFKPGDFVVGMGGWQQFALSDGAGWTVVATCFPKPAISFWMIVGLSMA